MSSPKDKTVTEKKTVNTQQAKPQPQAQPQLPLFYKRVVPLNRERHGELYIETVNGYAFAAETNSIFISAVEFPLAMVEYPIVFATSGDGGVYPVALLGLKNKPEELLRLA